MVTHKQMIGRLRQAIGSIQSHSLGGGSLCGWAEEQIEAVIAALEAEPLAVIEGGIAPSQLEHAKRGPDNPYDFWEICCRGPGFIPVRVAIYGVDE